jgi:hypothetical protein
MKAAMYSRVNKQATRVTGQVYQHVKKLEAKNKLL